MAVYKCPACGKKAEAHQVGRYSVPFVIFQCVNCKFILDIKPLEEVI